MNTFQKTAGRSLLIIFFLWHAFSVVVYTIPREAKDRYATLSHRLFLPVVERYMLITSQWQLWNLFSPDPLRRVTFYRIETAEGKDWRKLFTIEPGTYPPWEHATKFKMLMNTLDEFSNNRAPLAHRFLHLLCEEQSVAPETPIRLVYEFYTIPYHTQLMSRAWWESWKPDIDSYVGFTTRCPQTS